MRNKNLSNTICVAFVVCLIAQSVQMVQADRITMLEGKGRNVTGSIILINSEKVTVDVRGEKQEIPANIIASTTFEGEPSQLNTARSAVDGSRMTEALEALAKIDPKTLTKPEMKADYDYFKASSLARLVLSGSGNAAEAEKELLAFIKNHKNSYHYYEICELYGDLMVQMGKYDDAKKSYAALSKAPWPEYSLKATVALGIAEINENKIESARKNFESVIKKEDDSDGVNRLKGMAEVGLALCLSAEKKYDEAVKKLEEIARNSANEDSVFQSLIYNSLGKTYAAADKPKEAILAYTHTDILFSSARSEHIKALQELSKLWRKVRRAERGEDIDKRLKTLYNIGAN